MLLSGGRATLIGLGPEDGELSFAPRPVTTGGAGPLFDVAAGLMRAVQLGRCDEIQLGDAAGLDPLASEDLRGMIGEIRTVSLQRLPFTCAELMKRANDAFTVAGELLLIGIDRNGARLQSIGVTVEFEDADRMSLVPYTIVEQ